MMKKWLIINLNKKFFLTFGNKAFNCQIGSGGFQNAAKKIEGDKKTPIGKWQLISIYYRPDRVFRPKFKKNKYINISRITKNCGWCDDIRSNFYNQYIKINNLRSSNINYEKLWRKDEAYDIVIVTSHNTKPTIKNKGSAIFIHCSFPDKRNTAGCIALGKKNLVFLLNNLRCDTSVKIKK